MQLFNFTLTPCSVLKYVMYESLCNPFWGSRFQITCRSASLLVLSSFCLETVAMQEPMCVQCPAAANHCGKNCCSLSVPLEFCTLIALLQFQVEVK